MQVPKASDEGDRGRGGQLMTFIRPCEYIYLFVPDPEPNAGLEDETGSELMEFTV